MTRKLIHGGMIVTMDPKLGDLPHGDILVEDNRIAAIGPLLDAGDAEKIDAAGMIAIPGLVNGHMHTWQTGLRGVAGNWNIVEYFRNVHAGLATLFRPDDIGIANLVGALNQINCGTTALVDWCHNNPTPEHTDAAIEGLTEAGIRAGFFHGSPKPDPKPGQKPFWAMPHPRAEVERLLKSRFAGKDGLVTLGLAILGPHYSTYEVSAHDLLMARELGLIASMHCAGLDPLTPDGWQRAAGDNLLGDHNNIVHGNNLSDSQLQFMLERGVTFTLTPGTEMAQGHGFAITGRLRKLGAQPSLGVDLESSGSGDLFSVAQLALASQRALDNDESRARHGKLPATTTITTREALGWMTIEGAKMLKLGDRIGSLTPGKEADIVLIRADDLNMWPVHDPVTSVVTQSSIANIDTVLIAGQVRKRAGKLAYGNLAAKKAALAESGRRIVAELRARAHP